MSDQETRHPQCANQDGSDRFAQQYVPLGGLSAGQSEIRDSKAAAAGSNAVGREMLRVSLPCPTAVISIFRVLHDCIVMWVYLSELAVLS